MKMGEFTPNSQFAYPNSNVKVLGPVKAETGRFSWMIAPELKIDDIKKAYNQALSQSEGANLLVNLKEDTTYTDWGFGFMSVRYTIEGEAAQMTVGAQQLK